MNDLEHKMNASIQCRISFLIIMICNSVSRYSEIALSGASKLVSTYFSLFDRSVHVFYTELYINNDMVILFYRIP